MSENWTRRQLLRSAGTAAAAAAGLGAAACGRSDAARTAGAGTYKLLQHFVTRPDLHPPKVTLTYPARPDRSSTCSSGWPSPALVRAAP